jgi:hypothetical protein
VHLQAARTIVVYRLMINSNLNHLASMHGKVKVEMTILPPD